ncbi:RluA family pseudouridine synthase [Thalassospira sp.]|uniref:RluA family pseudouridine synthase n=1 Tax=Thalassospira sp. TaxID=1912094 RepID=UPI0027325DB4|nr:RNA pseudouridine synthase [Thalassospira sp.]MDP2699466.1 RNA pseudouridine synthase [Thalassospira sp.]
MNHPIADDLIAAVLHRDSNIIVLNKPPGLASHGGPKTYQHVDAYLPQLTFGILSVPVLAHRLDRDTAGCLMLCRHAKASKRITRLFTEKKIDKKYWAVVRGVMPDDHGMIDAPIHKHNDESGWRMEVHDDGQPSITEYRVLGRTDDLTWIELIPHTGRTHQLRVHLDHIGFPILGDPFYGTGKPPVFGGMPTLHLLARQLVVPFHADRDPVVVNAPPPELMRDALVACGYADGIFAVPALSVDAENSGDDSDAEGGE